MVLMFGDGGDDQPFDLRFLKVVRLARLTRMLRLHNLYKKITAFDIAPVVQNLSLVFIAVLLAHLLTCTWFMFGDGTNILEKQGYGEPPRAGANGTDTDGLALSGWLHRKPFRGLVLDWWTGYTDSFFTIIATPDVADSVEEKWFGSVVGLMFNAFIFGSLTAVITNMLAMLQSGDAAYAENMSNVSAFLSAPCFSRQNKRVLMKYFQSYYDEGQIYDEELLQLLPQRKANNIKMQMHQDLIRTNSFFFLMDTPMRAAFCLALRPAYAYKYEVIFEKGETALDLYVIVDGQVQLDWEPISGQHKHVQPHIHSRTAELAQVNAQRKRRCCGGGDEELSDLHTGDKENILSKHEIFGVAGMVGLGGGDKGDQYCNSAKAIASHTSLLFLTKANLQELDDQFDGEVTPKLKSLAKSQQQWLRLERMRSEAELRKEGGEDTVLGAKVVEQSKITDPLAEKVKKLDKLVMEMNVKLGAMDGKLDSVLAVLKNEQS
eukprot:SAG31_NODE_235_length_19695_cov_37.959790_11_plen_490_part_00